ncbi:SYF2 splicing factor-domain-containing protein [Gaertneriomyces semiglobifer]|nr:SYF2 splicing factor-domain-containing protein [Gaertneriomyces semiglobifer]
MPKRARSKATKQGGKGANAVVEEAEHEDVNVQSETTPVKRPRNEDPTTEQTDTSQPSGGDEECPPPPFSTSSSSTPDPAKLKAQMLKLQTLKRLRQASSAQNLASVKQEYRSKHDSPKQEVRQERLRAKAEKQLETLNAQKNGIDIERLRGLQYSIEDVEKWNEVQEKKEERKNTGFTTYADVEARKYNSLVSDLKPNLHHYAETKDKLLSQHQEDTFYRTSDSLSYASEFEKPSSQAVNRVVENVKIQEEKRTKHSRRRAFNEDEDVTYINERNMKFNKKISRAYDKYTKEIKDNFERGTAL